MTAFGIDPSLTCTGLCARTPNRNDDWTGAVTSKGELHPTLTFTSDRLIGLIQRIAELAGAHEPDVVVIESPSYGSKHGLQHERGGLWWGVVNELRERDLHVVRVAPTQLKKFATGRGNAHKHAVFEAAKERFDWMDIQDHNVADAAFLADIGVRYLNDELDGSEGLQAVEWM